MGRDRRQIRRNAKTQSTRPPSVPQSSRSKTLIQTTLVVLLALIGGTTWMSMRSTNHAPVATHTAPVINAASTASLHTKFTIEPKTLNELLEMPVERLGEVDMARMNLLCATGLAGAENLDIDKALDRLNHYAQRVRFWTDQSLWDFREHPGKFKNSEAKFRVLLLISVVQQDFGVHYNDRGERNCDFSNSKNAFLHGMIDDTNGGTCASMPVIYVAVGRRLGYPMKLVLAKTHIFARWEDPQTGERFNIEGTNPRFDDHPDSYYQNWPYPISEAELKQGWYLKPLTPAEELAVFLQNRACCLMDNSRFDEARVAYVRSYQLAPQNPLGRQQIAIASGTGGPVYVGPVASVRRPYRPGFVDEFGAPMVYRNQFDEVKRINAINRANMQRMMQPPQPGVPQPPNSYGPANLYGPQ